MKLINQSKDLKIIEDLSKAVTFWQRMVGLLGKEDLSLNKGLLITPCKIIHTFFMKFPLALIFLDDSNQVVELITYLQPNRVSPFVSSAVKVIELKARQNLEKKIELGDQLVILN
ncbi:DUF192 domain-containing protein [Sporohalobacter salinus]|uniref:DUF192 domain-containing protein n=1 Tax=Sporohalobacter salinus TaxID=1494606 RepID=UPI001961258D|nr:DUF192 domain-containing protein [Sporohalobacter salinus]MBM7623022.1 uncharacterized membrane protein (UPF0127 family) [Sporohalobacter salinus]